MKKNRKSELDVDFIGGDGPLTKEEEKIISEYIKSQKEKREKKQFRRTRTTFRKNVIA